MFKITRNKRDENHVELRAKAAITGDTTAPEGSMFVASDDVHGIFIKVGGTWYEFQPV